MNSAKKAFCLVVLLMTATLLQAAPEVFLKDIASVGGVRENQLLGIGLVTGLAGRGDSANNKMLKDAVANLVGHFGFDLSARDVRSRNCAVVSVSADIPAFLRAGERVTVTVSSLGDARSLEGGILLQTPLRAATGDVYVVAQGQVVVPQERTAVKTVGRVTSGAIAERDVVSRFVENNTVSVYLRHPDFVTAAAVKAAIVGQYASLQVAVRDSALIEITVPQERRNDLVSFIADLEKVTVKPAPSSKVVIDTNSGVIIMGEQVKIGKVAVSYKSTNVSVGSYYYSQSADHKEQFVLQETVTVEDFVKTVQAVGLDTGSIIEILKAIESAGALYGTLVLN